MYRQQARSVQAKAAVRTILSSLIRIGDTAGSLRSLLPGP